MDFEALMTMAADAAHELSMVLDSGSIALEDTSEEDHYSIGVERTKELARRCAPVLTDLANAFGSL